MLFSIFKGKPIITAIAAKTNFFGQFCISYVTVSAFASNLKVYPNPASQFVNVVLPQGINNATIELYNTIGAKQMHIETNSNVANINIANLQEGVYLFKIKVNNQNSVIRWIKE